MSDFPPDDVPDEPDGDEDDAPATYEAEAS
jgi:hypothetical protein